MQGFLFPFTADKGTKKFFMSDGIENIKQSIEIIVLTQKGERFSNPEFGCDLNQFMFEPITEQLLVALEKEVCSSILKFEKRIESLKVIVAEGENLGKVKVTILFEPKKYGSQEELVLEIAFVDGLI